MHRHNQALVADRKRRAAEAAGDDAGPAVMGLGAPPPVDVVSQLPFLDED